MKPGTSINSIAAVLAMLVMGLTGCVTYYPYDSGPDGVYYGRAPAHGYYPGPYHVNPAVYPYWSLDHFYFSRFHHPYSVYVGYREPHYYPYPGWVYGYSYGFRPVHHRYRHAGFPHTGFSAHYAFGYPWYGSGHHFSSFSLGFFVADGHRGHRRGGHDRRHDLRRIDQRLARMQQGREGPVSRSRLLGVSGRNIDRRVSPGDRGDAVIPARVRARSRDRIRILSASDRISAAGQHELRQRIERNESRRQRHRSGIAVERLRGRVVVDNAAETGRSERTSSRRIQSMRAPARHVIRESGRAARRVENGRSAAGSDPRRASRSGLLQRSRSGDSRAGASRDVPDLAPPRASRAGAAKRSSRGSADRGSRRESRRESRLRALSGDGDSRRGRRR